MNAGPDEGSQMIEDAARRKEGGMMLEADIGETQLATVGLAMTEQLGQQAQGTGPTVDVGLVHHPGHDHGLLGHAIVQEMEANVRRYEAPARTIQQLIPPLQSHVPLTHRMVTLTTDQDSHHLLLQQRCRRTLDRARPLFMQRPPSAAEITMSEGTACVVTTAPLTMATTLSLWRTCQYCALACQDHPRPHHPTPPCPLSQHCPKSRTTQKPQAWSVL